ncbi:MAG: PepSY domain-containing protein, partial [Candidatus Gracilibacteria bacterium]|nr:PepSY domain-containing protein [Candidatus Gracilibacteria bacterium]
MSPQKYIASTLVAIFLFSSLLPGQLFAAPKQSGKNITNISSIVRNKMGKQQEYLRSIGNPKEYQQTEIQWDTQKQKPSHIRGLSKKASKNIVADTKQVLKDFAPLYGVSAGINMDIRLAKNDISKLTKERHARLKQYYNNLEIVGGEILAHTDESGILYQVDGTPDVPNISTTPSITKAQALSIGTKEHGTKKKFEVTVQPELILYKFASTYILAYRYEVSYDDPVAHMGQWIYYIDAQTGKKINAYNLILDILNPASISGSILEGEGGSVKTFTGVFDTVANKYFMYDAFSASGLYYVFNASSNTGVYTDAFDYANRTTSDWSTSDTVEVSAAYNITKTLEYFNMFGFGT